MTTLTEMARLVRAEKRRVKRRAVLGRVGENIITFAARTFFNAWIFMLAVGIVHAEWIRALPTIGYWWSLLLVWMLRGVFSPTPSTETGTEGEGSNG